MQPYPHQYATSASGSPDGDVTVSSKGLPDLPSAPPLEFDGPGDRWSPETLFLGALADCYLLTFRAVAKASGLAFSEMSCVAEGKLDRVERVAKFTEIALRVSITVPSDADEAAIRRGLEKASRACIVSNSLALTPTAIYEVKRAPK